MQKKNGAREISALWGLEVKNRCKDIFPRANRTQQFILLYDVHQHIL
jgi:hypothetical protein